MHSDANDAILLSKKSENIINTAKCPALRRSLALRYLFQKGLLPLFALNDLRRLRLSPAIYYRREAAGSFRFILVAVSKLTTPFNAHKMQNASAYLPRSSLVRLKYFTYEIDRRCAQR